jgi:hypothetical protein
MGKISIFGLGGKSSIRQTLFADESNEVAVAKYDSKAEMGVAGINYYLPLSKNTFLINRLSASENGSLIMGEERNNQNIFFQSTAQSMRKYSVKEALSLSSKLSARHFVSAGLEYTHHFYDFYVEYFERSLGKMITNQDQAGNSGLVQLYGNWKYRINDNLTFVGGIHSLNNRLSNSWSVEPRAGVKWQITPTQRFNFGFGLHSQMESLLTYLVHRVDSSGVYDIPNKNLELAQSRHYVLGYENMLSPDLLLKVETYYQDLYNIPVENNPNSSYSLLNETVWYTDRELVNAGTGHNYGLELTLEKYLSRGYYFLFTASLYESKYRALDGILRDTRWNGNYVGNFLFGKEFALKSKPGRVKTIGINTRVSMIGARRFTPIDLGASRIKGYTVTLNDQAFKLRGDDIFVPNLSVTYRIDRKKTSHELKLDIQNITNNSGMVDMYYDHTTDRIEKLRQIPLLPVVLYTLEF